MDPWAKETFNEMWGGGGGGKGKGTEPYLPQEFPPPTPPSLWNKLSLIKILKLPSFQHCV